MAYNNVTDAVVRKVCKKYGEGSQECEVINLVKMCGYKHQVESLTEKLSALQE